MFFNTHCYAYLAKKEKMLCINIHKRENREYLCVLTLCSVFANFACKMCRACLKIKQSVKTTLLLF